MVLLMMPQGKSWHCFLLQPSVWKHILKRYAALYVDRHTIFRSPNTDKLSIDDELAGKRIKDTQFGRAMRQLGIVSSAFLNVVSFLLFVVVTTENVY